MSYKGNYDPKCWHKYGRHGPMPPFFNKDFSKMIHGIMGHFKDYMGDFKGFKGWIPHELIEGDDFYTVVVPLPGLSKDDVKVSLINDNLNVSTTKPKLEEDEGEKRRKSIFSWIYERPINLDIPLPTDADENNVKSMMKNGLLKIKLGKKPARKIDINTEESNSFK